MKSFGPLTIGIAARNEENTIRQMLNTALLALSFMPADAVEVIVAINDCTDNTEAIVREVVAETSIGIRVVHSDKGVIPAQRTIMKMRRLKGIAVFLDADLLIDRQCIRKLVQAMEDPSVYVAWGRPIPYDAGHPKFKSIIFNFSSYHPNLMAKKVYFTGRAFAVREYIIPTNPTIPGSIDSKLAKFLCLKEGPIIEDMYLSRAIIKRHGIEAIKYVASAKVYFQPIASLKDFYYSRRRAAIEHIRLDMLYPQLAYVLNKYYKNHLKRSVYKTAYNKLRPVRKLAFRLYRLLYSSTWKAALAQFRIYAMLLKFGVPLSGYKIWPALKTTKKAFRDTNARLNQ